MPTNIPAMPDLFKVGCYLPPSASEFYGFDIIKKTSRLIPDVEFHLYSLSGGSRSDYSLPKMGYKNIICYSSAIKSKDMSRFISKMSCGLRVVKHDGNPMSLAEYNAMGRWFVYNIEMPHCDLLKDRSPEKLVEIIRSVRSRDGLNHEGSSFYRKRHDKNKFLKDITDIYNKG
jgi:hypothetical protein